MNARPLAITIIGVLFIVVGGVGLIAILLNPQHYFAAEHLAEYAPMFVSEAVAIVGGAFLLRGCNWARWLLVAWMAVHLALGVMHSPMKFAVHIVMFSLIAFFLFRGSATAYFNAGGSKRSDGTFPPSVEP